MKQVDISIERLLEIRDNPKGFEMKGSETVQAFLVRWCLETFNEVPLVTMIQRLTAETDSWGTWDKKTTGGLAFEFQDGGNAMLFKLTWV